MSQPQITLLGLCYKFAKRAAISLPYWLDQGVNLVVAAVMNSGDVNVLSSMTERYRWLTVPVFITADSETTWRPLQRAAMYRKMIEEVHTPYVGFFDVDNIPHPDTVRRAIAAIDLTGQSVRRETAVSIPRIDIPARMADSLTAKGDLLDFHRNHSYASLWASVASYMDVEGPSNWAKRQWLADNQFPGLRRDTGAEFAGYFQAGRTQTMRAAASRSDRNSVAGHDYETRDNLKAAGVRLVALDISPALHITHPRSHDKVQEIEL